MCAPVSLYAYPNQTPPPVSAATAASRVWGAKPGGSSAMLDRRTTEQRGFLTPNTVMGATPATEPTAATAAAAASIVARRRLRLLSKFTLGGNNTGAQVIAPAQPPP